ncbi:hypothetical protein JTE90_012923 [Oedothorax gibbosus]|uniref:VWFA domain-containing protein n=1 Tax=Oedothorax gibbosus TaxID=931172 RepID=A0AAV6V177_9ARAC|nr:hypothetical protein JTE90_012923 [Oedothorax gibbosus]
MWKIFLVCVSQSKDDPSPLMTWPIMLPKHVDLNRKIGFVANDLEPIVQGAILRCIHPSCRDEARGHLTDILDHMYNLSNVRTNATLTTKVSGLKKLIRVLEELEIPETQPVLAKCKTVVENLFAKVNSGNGATGGRFEWVDSILIHAVSQGHWLLIDDANFCSPSVLDRLNSLLEPNGVLTVSEQGVVGNDLRTITPHRDFRIFLTMNPKNGEISRPMRNRGVEIFIEPIGTETVQWKQDLDVAAFAQCKGLVHSTAVSKLFEVHNQLGQNPIADFLSATSLYAQLLQNHKHPEKAFLKVCKSIYGHYGQNDVFERHLPELTKEFSLPLTSLLPTSIDYRHSAIFAAVKKQSAVFTYFLNHLKNFIKMKAKDPNAVASYFPYPTPNLPSSTSVRNRFLCIMRIMMDTCSLKLHKLLDIWLQYTLEYEIKHETPEGLKENLNLCLRLKNELGKQMGDPIVQELLSYVAEIYDIVEIPDVLQSELTIDPRWLPNVYRQILFNMIKSAEEDNEQVEMAAQMVPYKIEKLGNKFNLLLLWKTQEFTMPGTAKSSQCCLMQTDKVLNIVNKKHLSYAAIPLIPDFLQRTAESLMELLRTDKWDCPNTSYWMFRDAMNSYFTCRKICEEKVDNSKIDYQLTSFSVHFYWLAQKIKTLYSSDNVQLAFKGPEVENGEIVEVPIPKQELVLPETVKANFLQMTQSLSNREVVNLLRLKLIKKLDHPQGFNNADAADIYKKSLELYKVTNLFSHLNSSDISTLKIVLSNLKEWMLCLTKSVHGSVFQSAEIHPQLEHRVNALQLMKEKLQFFGLINTEDNMEPNQNHIQHVNIPNKKLISNIQLLPLLDYFFILYSSDLLHDLHKFEIVPEMLAKIGCEHLCADPNHLANILNCLIRKKRTIDVLSTVTYLGHLRHGFASEGLNFLQYQLSEDGSSAFAPALEWNDNLLLSKQGPILSYMCNSLFDKPSDAPLMCRSPLGGYVEKFQQLESVKVALWTNLERLADPLMSFRPTTSLIIRSWFFKLLNAVAATKNVEYNPDENLKDQVFHLFQESKIHPLCVTDRQADVLALAFKCYAAMESKMKQGVDDQALMWETGKCYIAVGLLTTMLLLPRDSVDPAVKRNLKAEDYDQKHQEILMEKALRDWIYQVTNGQTLEELAAMSSVPYLNGLFHLQQYVSCKVLNLQKKLIVRPNLHGFERLKEILNNFVTQIGSPDTIIEITQGIFTLVSSNVVVKENPAYGCLQRAENLVKNMKSLVGMLIEKFHFYGDLIMPFIAGIEQIMYGLSLARQSALLKEMDQNLQLKGFKSVADFLTQMVSFPFNANSSPLSIACTLLNADNITDLKTLLTMGNVPPLTVGRLVYKLLKSAILEIINEVRGTPQLKENTVRVILRTLTSAFNALWHLWNAQETEIKKKKEAEDSWFVNKVKHHETEISDDEAIKRRMKMDFPSFDNDFGDCITEQPDILAPKEETPLEIPKEDLHLPPDDIFEIWRLHATAMAALSPTELLNSDKNMKWVYNNTKELDITTPYLLRYEVVCEVVKSMPHRLDGKLDSELAAGHLMMCNELQKRPKIDLKTYDIYHDPNPEEVLKIYPILNKLDAHVKELLTEFPEHASLVQILKLTQRVLSFPVTDPLMKFVIGMELILQTNQFWEAMAHKNISLKYENEELTKKIIECRAMELNCWRSGLESVLRKQYKNSSKWWCHIFSIFASLIENPTNKSDYVTALNGLKQFLEDSPICEFSARLSILHTFFQQSKLSESMHSYKNLSQMFFNLYCYYEQFLPDIEKRIEQIRSPIEKEIKNFVKIARWNDINFHAVKSSVEHSHKFVVKQVKAFEDALKIPAKQVFALPSKKDLENDESLQWILEINKEHFLSKDQIVQEAFSTKPGTFLEKVPRFDAKIRKFSRKFSKSLPVINHINTLNEFAGTVMESLQSVISDSGKKMCTRSQDKKQALLLIQKKKQMLSTLFKNLRVIGLSYRQGMIYAKNKNENDILIVSAFDPKYLQIVKFDREFGELLSKVSQDTSHYFYKSIAQYSLLYKYMESPSKDLSLDIIHRIQGYSGNLLKYIIDQREELVTASKTVDEMGAFVNMLSALKEEKFTSKIVAIPPQGDISRHEDLLNNLMVQYMTLLNQFGTLMECAPVQIEDIFSALPFKAGVFFLPTKNTSLWNTIMGNIFECSKALKESFNVISASSQTPAKLLTWAKFSRITEDFKRLAILITKTVQAFELQRPRYQSITLKDLYELLKKVTEQSNKVLNYNQFVLQTKVDEVAEEKNDRLVGTVQRLTKEVLLVFQDIMKSVSEEVDDEESSVDVYPESLFTVKISQYLTKFVEMLRLEKVLKLMQKTKRIIQHSSKTVEDIRSIDASIRLLANLTPFLNQYFQLVKVSLAANVGMHRTSCKFLSILLEVFNILATKGFCIPAELKEEAEKSGATKFEDIEGGGLGEGEGANDVSDKIESEDQLEDTFKEGQEKEENKEEQSDIKNEEHGIEMSEDFEGKSYNPEGEDENEDKEAESEEEDPDLDKQMGDVDAEDAEKLDEKVWGSDSEDEDEELNEDDDATGGVTDDKSSEMVAKEGQEREMDDRKNKDKGQKQEDSLQDSQTDDYQGEVPDPMIDAPQDEPEVVELPDDMEINDDEKEGNEDNDDTLEINCDPTEQLDSEAEGSDQEAKEEEAMDAENENSENPANKAEEESEDEMNSANAAEPASEDENAQEDGNDTKLPTHTPTFEPQAQPAGDQSKSKSKDPVQEEASMDWENGALPPEDQHREGQADAKDAYDQGTGHEGQTSTSSRKPTEDQTQHKPKLKSPSENRTLDDDPNTANIKHRPIADKQSRQKSQGQPEDNDDGEADVYEHVESKEDGTTQAVDIATEAQAAINPVEAKNNGGYDSDDVIELSSDEEVEPPPMRNNVKTQGDTSREDRRQRPGERGENEEEIMEIDDGEIVRTHTVSLGKTTIHTQHDLWSSMTNIRFQEQRYRVEHDLFKHYDAPATSNAIKLWGDYENLVSNLSQELCEQLRLVLEPTKMTKLKGDYRTGKRLNMRKIIPYIASQFRKDKIWLRRTKPSKREYQIMLAVDDSSSMADNHSKQLAFESLAVLGQSLSLLEAGELSVVSFGEQVELLLGFNEQFSTATGARMFQKFTFAQKKTRYLQLLQYAKEAMVQARNANASMSKDTAQLLVIISDGRGINNEGEKAVLEAVRQARDNNIFMVFIIIDNPNNKDSILDITIPIFESDNKVTMKSYIESFPFPFYIILRDISTLPVVLGEALRQWFELVTSAER